MSVVKVLLVTLLAGSLSISVALFGQRWIDAHPNLTLGFSGERQSPAVLPDLRLTDVTGSEVGSHRWAGKILVMHYWATWCAPCLAQLSTLEQLQARYKPGVLVVAGIAIDQPEAVANFLAERGLNYQVLLGGMPEVELSADFGNRTWALPFTAVFSPNGRLIFSHAGELSAEELGTQIQALQPDDAETRGPL